MGDFIKKTGLFLFVSAVIVGSIIFAVHFLINVNSNLKVSDDKNLLVFGNSHSECAFDDTLIYNSKNLSSSGETYFYTYQKIKKILSQNKQITTIFIEFTNIQIESEMDDWTWGYDQMSGKFPIYSSFMDKDDFQLLYKNNPKSFLSVVSKSTRENLIMVFLINMVGFCHLK